MKSDHQKGEASGQKNSLAKYLRYSHVGILFFAAVGLFTWGGIELDRKLGTGVLFTILGLILGFAGGLRALYREIYRGDRKTTSGEARPGGEERDRDERGGRDP